MSGCNDASRSNKDIELYNRVALDLCAENNVERDDLYSLTKMFDKDVWSDNVHFDTKEGETFLGEYVSNCIRKHCK